MMIQVFGVSGHRKESGEMDGDWQEVVTEERLSSIQAVARDGGIRAAVLSLLAWGVINVLSWLIFGGESREMLIRMVTTPSGGLSYLLYGGLFLGLGMVALAALGYVSRAPATILLNGFALLAVGVSNVIHDFVANAVVQPYGYHLEKIGYIWILLGVVQIGWGLQQFSAFRRVTRWSPAHLDGDALEELKALLHAYVNLPEQVEAGIVKTTITSKGFLGFNFLQSTTQYTGRLLDGMALMVSSSLDDCFTIEREALAQATFVEGGALTVATDGATREMAVGATSTVLLKEWGHLPVSAADVRRIVTEKTATISLLQPFLAADDPQMRAAAVAALTAVADPAAAELLPPFLAEPAAPVRAAAIDAAKRMGLTTLHAQVLPSLTHPDPAVRIASARYFGEFPSAGGATALAAAADQETVADVKKALTKAQKASLRTSQN